MKNVQFSLLIKSGNIWKLQIVHDIDMVTMDD